MADEQNKNGLFREKSIEAVQSPDSLNDYLKVTSPGVWVILAAVIVLLIGAVIWSIFGRIESTMDVAVIAEDGHCVCLVPYDNLDDIVDYQTVTIDGTVYTLQPDLNATPEVIPESANPYALVAGNLTVGDVVVEVPVDAELDDSIYTGTIVTESIQPITLLLE